MLVLFANFFSSNTFFLLKTSKESEVNYYMETESQITRILLHFNLFLDFILNLICNVFQLSLNICLTFAPTYLVISKNNEIKLMLILARFILKSKPCWYFIRLKTKEIIWAFLINQFSKFIKKFKISIVWGSFRFWTYRYVKL